MSAPKVKGPPLISKAGWLFAAACLLGGGVVMALGVRGEPERKVKFEITNGHRLKVSPSELAAWGLDGRRDYVVVDLRPDDDFKEGHIRGAVSCGTCHATKTEGEKADQGDTFVDLTKKVVLYTESGAEPVKLPKKLAENPRLYLLEGGWEGWKSQVLAPVAFGGETSEAELDAKVKRDAVRAFYAGERPQSGKKAVLPIAPIKREGAHAPAKAAEGC
jgi:rhodanese-related sulfurtransferase